MRIRAALIVGALLLTACYRRGKPAASGASSSGCEGPNGIGRLTLVLTTTPTVSTTTEALVRLESVTDRSTVRVNAVLGTTFELRPGAYRLSISLPGYASAERSATIVCGTERTLTVPMAPKR